MGMYIPRPGGIKDTYIVQQALGNEKEEKKFIENWIIQHLENIKKNNNNT